jgi:hypothetical protein
MPEVIEEVKDNLEVKQQKETTADTARGTETENYYMRILIKTAKIETYQTRCEAVKELKILQQNNSQMSLTISVLLK